MTEYPTPYGENPDEREAAERAAAEQRAAAERAAAQRAAAQRAAEQAVQPTVDPSTLRSAYAFDGSGPYLYAPDGSGPYAYTHDGRGPFLIGSATGGYVGAGAHPQGGVQPYAPQGGVQQPYAAQQYGPYAYHATALPPKPNRRRRVGLAIGAGVAALAIISAAGGTAFGLAGRTSDTTTSTNQSQSGTQGGFGPNSGSSGSGSSGSGSSGSGSSGTGTGSESAATAATDSQKAGLVTIVSTLDYDSSSQAAGTGMIISSSGEILTNNHVIDGATSITVTVESTGKSYTASVVGTDPTDDVAVLQLANASGLTTVTLDTKNDVSVGDTVTDVGNAEGTGNLVAATGQVTALNQDITVQSESGSGTESLTGLIEVAADVVSGDSGGPILDTDGEVVGMTTAASSGSADVTGYAIPIATAKAIADEIIGGKASSTITIGLPAFMGAEVSSTSSGSSTSGVTLQGVVSGSPAEKAGLAAGDTITSIDGTAVTGASQLTSLIQAHSIGDSVSVGYTAADGSTGTVTVTLVAGPAN